MKRIILSIVLSLAAAAAFGQIPNIKLEDIKGNTVATQTILDGKTPVIISFWAMTCKPCIRELDAINDLLPDWREEADFKIVAISTDDSRFSSKARAMAQGHGWKDFVLLFDKNQEFMRAMNVSVTPQVFVLDGKGKVVYSHTGYTPGSENELLKAVKNSLR